MKKMIAMLLLAAMCLALFAGCAKSETDPTDAKKLILATSADYPPFEFHIVDKDGKDAIVGIDVSVAKKIAQDMGMELEILDISFDNLVTAMEKGQADIVISAMESDEKREASVDFSDAYYTDYPPLILVKKENAGSYASLSDFDGKTVGAQTATTKESAVKELMPGATLLSLASVNDLVNNLVYDKCDAVVLDYAVAKQYAESNDQLAIASVELGQAAAYKVAVQEGDPKGLLPEINKIIAQIISDGTMDQYIADAEALYAEG